LLLNPTNSKFKPTTLIHALGSYH